MMLRWILGIALLSLLFADILIFHFEPPWIETWIFYYGIVYIAITILISAWALAQRDWVGAAMFAICAATCFYCWWDKTKKRRKKLADKASGIVVDMGGRLKVVREPIAET